MERQIDTIVGHINFPLRVRVPFVVSATHFAQPNSPTVWLSVHQSISQAVCQSVTASVSQLGSQFGSQSVLGAHVSVGISPLLLDSSTHTEIWVVCILAVCQVNSPPGTATLYPVSQAEAVSRHSRRTCYVLWANRVDPRESERGQVLDWFNWPCGVGQSA